jgi:hypothetical protein
LRDDGDANHAHLIEVIPPFLLGTFLMFALDKIGVLPAIIEAGEPLVSGWLGLPKEASAAFVMGFLRRDFIAPGSEVRLAKREQDARMRKSTRYCANN